MFRDTTPSPAGAAVASGLRVITTQGGAPQSTYQRDIISDRLNARAPGATGWSRRWASSTHIAPMAFQRPLTVFPLGVATVAAIGTPALVRTIASVGVASAEAVGAARVVLALALAGIASAEAVGAASISASGEILPLGIASAEGIGHPHTFNVGAGRQVARFFVL